VQFLFEQHLNLNQSIHEGDNMRKLLLATTALFGSVAFIGAAHASPAPTSPITLNVGGYVDFVAGFYHEPAGIVNPTGVGTGANMNTTSRDFEDEFKLNFDAMGKASNGMQYGANVSLWNGSEATNLWRGGQNSVELASAYVWMSGAFGKVLLGDAHGASDLFVYAPTVGEGQIDGRFMDFVSPLTLARFYASGIDNTEHSTNITYYTPKVGNDDNKVQLGITYEPNMYDYGQNVLKFSNNTGAANTVSPANQLSPYQDVVKSALEYTGNFHPVNLAASAQLITGSAGNVNMANTQLGQFSGAGLAGSTAQDFTAWGLGTQVGFGGFTLGGSWNDMGRYMTVHGQNKSQDDWTIGGKYEFDKVAVGVSYLNGEGYNNLFATSGAGGIGQTIAKTVTQTNYVDSYNAYGVGAAYTWFPGLTTNADAVLFNQSVRDQLDKNDGYVLLISQKMTF
jgi:outer membrane protein OmpU